jgi:DNA-binding beta-propeller fold protein YncE
MYILEFDGGRIFKRTPKGELSHFAGTGKSGYGGDGGPAISATFKGMHSLSVSNAGDVYVADTHNNCVRRIDGKTQIITTIAGTTKKGFAGDGGSKLKAQFNGIYCVDLNDDETKLYLADLGNKRIRMIDLKTDLVTTVAGTGKRGKPTEGGVAAKSPLVDPRAVAVDSKGNVYILERGGHALRVVTPDGKIETVAGLSGKKGKVNGNASESSLNGPKHLYAVPNRSGSDATANNRIVIADAENSLIREYDPKTGLLSTLPIKNTKRPHGVSIGRDGFLYVADSYKHRVVRYKGK